MSFTKESFCLLSTNNIQMFFPIYYSKRAYRNILYKLRDNSIKISKHVPKLIIYLNKYLIIFITHWNGWNIEFAQKFALLLFFFLFVFKKV